MELGQRSRGRTCARSFIRVAALGRRRLPPGDEDIYSLDELKALVAGLRDPGYCWDIGQIKLGSAPAHATYLIGYPP